MTAIHVPLDPTLSQIRMLTLLSGMDDGPINCTLTIHSLDDEIPEFEALSYVWGENVFMKPVTVNGAVIRVTNSLDAALRGLRRKDSSRTLWIDAICINQVDILEKNTQVPLMGRIYSTALKVLVWLGDTNPDIDFLVSWDVSRYSRDGQRVVSEPDERILARGAMDIISHPYWSRMWTYQEYRLSKSDPVLICGPNTFSLNAVLKFIAYATSREGPRPENTPWPSTGQIFDIANLMTSRENSLGRLLMDVCRRRCIDPRDHVYALYGMLSHIPEELLPDYRKSPKSLMFETVAYLSRKTSSLIGDLLCHYGLHQERMVDHEFPSWLPDLCESVGESESPYQFMPANTLEPSLLGKSSRKVSDDYRSLFLVGRAFGTCKVSFRFEHSPEEIMRQIYDVQFGILTSAESLTESERLDAGNKFDRFTKVVMSPTGPEPIIAMFRSFGRMMRDRARSPEELKEAGSIEKKVDLPKEILSNNQALLRQLRGKTVFSIPELSCERALGSADVMDGDLVVVASLMWPIVLRPVKVQPSASPEETPKTKYRFVGFAFVGGAMSMERSIDPQVKEWAQSDELETFEVI